MQKNRQGFLVSDTHRECTNCHEIYKITSKTVTLCNTCNSTRVKSMDPRKRMLARAKARAKSSNKEFTITLDDIKIPTHCPVMGIELKAKSGSPGGSKHSPSLDRIDASKGYTPDNVWVISMLANAMKANATDEELKTFARWIIGRD